MFMSTSNKRHESLQNKICKRIKIYATLVSGIKRRRKGWKIFAHWKNNQIYNLEMGLKIVPQGVKTTTKRRNCSNNDKNERVRDAKA